MKELKLQEELVISILNYLATKPYNEVAILISNLQQQVQSQVAQKEHEVVDKKEESDNAK